MEQKMLQANIGRYVQNSYDSQMFEIINLKQWFEWIEEPSYIWLSNEQILSMQTMWITIKTNFEWANHSYIGIVSENKNEV